MKERSRETHWLHKYIKVTTLDQDKSQKTPPNVWLSPTAYVWGRSTRIRQMYRDVFPSFPAQFPTVCGWRTSWASCWSLRLLFHCCWWTFLSSIFPITFCTCVYFWPSASSANEFHCSTRICVEKNLQRFLLCVLTPLPCHFVWSPLLYF